MFNTIFTANNIYGIVFLSIGVICAFLFFKHIKNSPSFKKDSISLNATIISFSESKELESSSEGPSVYTTYYRPQIKYFIGQEEFTYYMPYKRTRRPKIGKQIKIKVHPSDLSKPSVAGEYAFALPLYFIIMIIGCGVLGIVCLFFPHILENLKP
ncbi:hypothetical protein AAIR98_000531 [Elusimicrobium simillimum]|uniref:hypothetical protein n=1 Tax=Elusimicrobium simillimum TaxID=3143438 RepID=UPI003C6EB604